MVIKPLGERILVKVEKADNKLKSGIVLSDASINPNYFKGEVVGLSVGYKDDSHDPVEVGDRVAFLKYGYEDMGDDLYLVEPQALLAVIAD